MDVISEVIRRVRVGTANARLITYAGSWGTRFPSFAGSGFHIILRGNAWLITATGDPVAVGLGDVVFVPSGAVHGFSHTPTHALDDLATTPMGTDLPGPGPLTLEFLCGAYRLEHGRAPQYLHELPDVITVSPDYDRHPELRALVDLLGADVSETRMGTGATLPALMDLVLVHVLRQWHEQQGTVQTPSINDPAIAGALQEIHDNPQWQWTVDRLSASAGMSRTAFTRRFTALVGKPPMRYVIDRRLRRGANLLIETDAPLATIARQVGYATEFAFAGAFRREYGISPGRYRHSAHAAPATGVASR